MVAAALPANLKPISQVNLPGKNPGKRMHVNSLHRLIHHGVVSPAGTLVRLRAWKCAGVWMTNDEAVAEFVDAMRSDAEFSRPRNSDSSDACRRLEAMGI